MPSQQVHVATSQVHTVKGPMLEYFTNALIFFILTSNTKKIMKWSHSQELVSTNYNGKVNRDHPCRPLNNGWYQALLPA